MPTNLDPTGRPTTTRGALSAACGLLAAARKRLARSAGEDGFLLIEVMVSALLVSLIVTATLSGFDVAGKVTSDQRHRGEAELLAAESEEQLRSDPATALDELVGRPHTYKTSINGVTYTVLQEATSIAANGSKTGCTVTETTSSTAANFRTVSTVSWNTQEKSKRPPVKQTSIISPPTGSGIEVDIVNGANGPVSGVTARAKFIPNESGAEAWVEGTTGPSGCIVLSGIQSTEAKVEILEKTGFVTPNGNLAPKPVSLPIAPNVTVHQQFQFAEAGAIRAEFTYKGATSWEGKEVKSDTFVAGNALVSTKPEQEVGSTSIVTQTGGEEPYEALTGTYAPSASYTAKASKYPLGDLFPFATAWSVWSGDCSANKEAVAEPGAIVTSGNTTTAKVPVAVTKLSIYKGTGPSNPETAVEESLKPTKVGAPEVKITNTGCASAETPNNATGLEYVHTQKETLPASTKGSQLENPFQPTGTFSMCLVSSAKKQTYTVSYANTVAKPGEPKFYLNQRITAAVKAEKTEKEVLYKAEETAYKADETKYKTAETKFKEREATYKAKEANKEKNKEAETKKKEYESHKKEYETEKKEYERTKKEYERTKKSSYKTEYEKYEKEYKEDEKQYKEAETAYKAAEKAYEEYAKPKAEYEAYLAEYTKYKTEYVEAKEEAITAKKAYETAKKEEEDAAKSGVTVAGGEEC
jgi:Tfp pilus assembly protein PilV